MPAHSASASLHIRTEATQHVYTLILSVTLLSLAITDGVDIMDDQAREEVRHYCSSLFCHYYLAPSTLSGTTLHVCYMLFHSIPVIHQVIPDSSIPIYSSPPEPHHRSCVLCRISAVDWCKTSAEIYNMILRLYAEKNI
ncbi:hypothetical protein BC628DRAFT_1350016 [Trametes gibbosa]|nr:hypothetical protein BC628DRAFT_1396328 [Trametes gibbosa]KAI0820899.1 hypothetical protein BC628DRAFT_1394906 [Trametes gibbosa]KAI0823553.1 hypothetical protein BC628DRAFT_1383751 [Trametes gibbosa]KAI0826914.1 hypothetical protein BC628DRAFT_1372577 [Trametes gibbosa]KAI0829282.1 hypothetical protein BC628DRAFT_1359896 [Trametes gibbosa]